jgi:hypothetical protein
MRISPGRENIRYYGKLHGLTARSSIAPPTS